VTAFAPAAPRSGKRIALGLGGLAILLSILIASALLLAPGFRERVREEWHIRRLRSRDWLTRMDAALQLLDMRSERGLVRLLKEPLPEFILSPVWVYFGNYPLQPACRLIQEIGPRNLDRIYRGAFERGELTEAEILGFCNRSVPGVGRGHEGPESR
jgi:hypothetical protein